LIPRLQHRRRPPRCKRFSAVRTSGDAGIRRPIFAGAPPSPISRRRPTVGIGHPHSPSSKRLSLRRFGPHQNTLCVFSRVNPPGRAPIARDSISAGTRGENFFPAQGNFSPDLTRLSHGNTLDNRVHRHVGRRNNSVPDGDVSLDQTLNLVSR
jgi:hypothetical protein